MQLMQHKILQKLFSELITIVIVGLSPKENRPSYQVARYLKNAGYQIIPVNPGHQEILGEICYPDVLSVPVDIDVVDIFRRADQVLPVARQAIAVGAKVLWMQQGIVNQEAERIAEQAGMLVIMDRCLKVDHMQFASSTL